MARVSTQEILDKFCELVLTAVEDLNWRYKWFDNLLLDGVANQAGVEFVLGNAADFAGACLNEGRSAGL